MGATRHSPLATHHLPLTSSTTYTGRPAMLKLGSGWHRCANEARGAQPTERPP